MKLFSIIIIIIAISCTSQNENIQPHSENSFETINEITNTQEDSLKNEITYYSNGHIKSKIDYLEDENHFIYKDYYSNGQLKLQGEQGDFNTCGIAVNDEFHYDSLGFLIEKKSYYHYLIDKNDGCHATQTIISDTLYYSSGRILAT